MAQLLFYLFNFRCQTLPDASTGGHVKRKNIHRVLTVQHCLMHQPTARCAMRENTKIKVDNISSPSFSQLLPPALHNTPTTAYHSTQV